MIQIATVGDTQVVVKEGIRKEMPEKLYILHTANERSQSEFEKAMNEAKKSKDGEKMKLLKIKQYEDNVKELKKEIQNEFNIPVKLAKVGKFDSYDVIREIQNIISKEKKENPKLDTKEFAINITGGTKAMVAGAACAAYLAQTKMYYVLHYDEAKGKELVRELPVPYRVKNKSTITGSTEKATSLVLKKIWKLGELMTRTELEEALKDEKIPTEIKDKKGNIKTVYKKFTPQKLNYHLNKLEDSGIIIRTRGKKKESEGITRKTSIIELTDTGRLYAAYPETIGEIL